MLLDVGVLLVGERPWPVEEPVGDRKLADVVQPRRATQITHRRRLQAQHRRDPGRDLARVIGVVTGPRGLRVDNPSKRFGDLIQPILVGDQHPVGRLDAREVRISQRCPEARVRAQRAESVNQGGIEPLPGALCGYPVGRAHPSRRVKNLHRLREAQDTGR